MDKRKKLFFWLGFFFITIILIINFFFLVYQKNNKGRKNYLVSSQGDFTWLINDQKETNSNYKFFFQVNSEEKTENISLKSIFFNDEFSRNCFFLFSVNKNKLPTLMVIKLIRDGSKVKKVALRFLINNVNLRIFFSKFFNFYGSEGELFFFPRLFNIDAFQFFYSDNLLKQVIFYSNNIKETKTLGLPLNIIYNSEENPRSLKDKACAF